MAELTYAQIMAQRQQEAHERLREVQDWAVSVTEELANQRSTFLEEFDENERRTFGLIDAK